MNLVGEYEAKKGGLDDEKKKAHLKNYVREDLVKRNNVPPLEKDIILKFSRESGVLITATEKEISKKASSNDSSIGGIGS